MLNAHTKRYNNMGQTLQKEVITMQGRVQVVETKTKILKKEVALVFGKGTAKDLGEMKESFKGLKTMLSSDSKAQAQKLDQVLKDAGEAKKEKSKIPGGMKLFQAIEQAE